MELDECVETLIFLQSTDEQEYASQFHVIGSRHYQGADDILLRLAALVSFHAFNLVRQEYELFKGGSLDYGGRWLQDGMVQLRSSSTHKEYVVNTKSAALAVVSAVEGVSVSAVVGVSVSAVVGVSVSVHTAVQVEVSILVFMEALAEISAEVLTAVLLAAVVLKAKVLVAEVLVPY
ncbi:hypothetical protein PHMEG_000714 [Phytophthora megakarya]|uniref:Uncharacterized protein n=1 Tax=Phytophthora megakarya TaxID=4795 RepID=A0A225X2E0_9STRA|nr:hypothetical protein PHMEG_000714 [Phytophthora megakarya]